MPSSAKATENDVRSVLADISSRDRTTSRRSNSWALCNLSPRQVQAPVLKIPSSKNFAMGPMRHRADERRRAVAKIMGMPRAWQASTAWITLG